MEKKESKIEMYDRKSAFATLKNFDYMSDDEDFIEVTEWKNREGFDVYISRYPVEHFILTHGQFVALKKCIKTLNNRPL